MLTRPQAKSLAVFNGKAISLASSVLHVDLVNNDGQVSRVLRNKHSLMNIINPDLIRSGAKMRIVRNIGLRCFFELCIILYTNWVSSRLFFLNHNIFKINYKIEYLTVRFVSSKSLLIMLWSVYKVRSLGVKYEILYPLTVRFKGRSMVAQSCKNIILKCIRIDKLVTSLFVNFHKFNQSSATITFNLERIQDS